jgi:signal transduction histidine kinase
VKLIFSVITLWLVFVLSLAGWWLYFGINTLANIGSGSGDLARHQRMLFMEGTVLISALLLGGVSLFYFAYRMYKEKSVKEMFFASFTHDMKTALFRLQLDLEKLSKKHGEVNTDPLFTHTRKMQLDLENGLDSSVGLSKSIFFEELSLKEFIQELHAHWPEFRIKVRGDAKIRSDRKALNSIFKNLLHNSYVHGEADEVVVQIGPDKGGIELSYCDNGKELAHEPSELGQMTHPSSGSSGFGLYIVRQWIVRMGWHIVFSKSPEKSLKVTIHIPGGAL